MRLPENFVQEVLDRTDIEELIGRYVTLKRTGSNLVGLCPFHSEKTPSFTVSPSKNMFFCFGCHAGGSAITFVQKAENLEFTDAVAFLADRAGLPMPRETDDAGRTSGVSRKRVLEANLEAAKFFRACLFDPAIGKAGMDYFKGTRGLTEATIKHFGLGFAPNTFGSLTDYMKGKGFTDEELQTAFLCGKSQKTGRSYDYFRNRVMFPIIDTSGNIVAFGGRVLDDSKPKYLNTSDTPAFKKSNHLFALNFARHSCTERMILCEGYMDVIALHAAGFEFAVATLGTAITPNHARIFSKYTKKVIISYDADEAGQNAANKAMRVLGDVGMEVRVLRMSGAKDPDEYIRKFGADRFRRLLDESRTGFEYKLENILGNYDLSVGQEKIRASSEVCEVIAGYPSPVEREVYLREAAKRLELPDEVLKNSVERIRHKQAEAYKAQQTREVRASIKHFGDRINPDSAKDPKAAAAEENVLGLLLLFGEYRKEVVDGRVGLEASDFVTSFHRRVFEAIMRMQASEEGFRFAMLGEDFTPDEMGRIQRMEVARRELTENGPEVFRLAAETLRRIAERNRNRESDLQSRLDYLRKAKLHKGKEQNE
ncbi:MAG: DNA primase [Clostridia bacterium]|nr:DNA primase [Clostridia bacterium]